MSYFIAWTTFVTKFVNPGHHGATEFSSAHQDRRVMNAAEMVQCSKEMIFPFMEKTDSKLLIFDCTNVYHNVSVCHLFESNGIEVYGSAGLGRNENGGYPPNSHETMPNETMHAELKERIFKKFFFMRNSRRTVVSLHRITRKCASEYSVESVRNKILKLPEIMNEIVRLEGKRTKY